MTERYVVLGDVVGSRDIADRQAFGERLRRTCREINEEHDRIVQVPFAPLKGIDEVGGVLTSVEGLYRIVRALADRLRPNVIRLAVVGGTVDVRPDANEVSAMDGPVFHRADELLSELDRRDYRFGFEGDYRPLDTLVTDEVNLLLYHRRKLTECQRKTVEAYVRHGTQQAAAEALDVTQQTVSKVLRAAGWPMLGTIENRLTDVLAGYDDE